MTSAVNVCAAVCSLLLVVWCGMQMAPRASRASIDRLGAVCFVALGVTSAVTFRMLVVAPSAARGPLPVFVFLGVPIGFALGWLSWRLARTS